MASLARTVLFNADDLGLSAGVDAGILEALTRGHVHTTSAMVCDPGSRSRVSAAAPPIRGRVGLHLQLTDGRPISDPASVPSLVDADGRFQRRPSVDVRWRTDEVLLEWRRQLEALRALGVEPSHLDSHHNAHFVPHALKAYVALARETGVRARSGAPWVLAALRRAGVSCPDRCETPWSEGGTDVGWTSLIEALRRAAAQSPPAALIEIACHPAHVDAALEARSAYAARRTQELAVLCDPDLPARLADEGYVLAPRPG